MAIFLLWFWFGLDAAAQVEEVAVHVNEYIRLHDNFLRMLNIQNSLYGHSVPGILAPARKFIHEGKLLKVSRSSLDSYLIFMTLFLLNFYDVVLILLCRFVIESQRNELSFCFRIFWYMQNPNLSEQKISKGENHYLIGFLSMFCFNRDIVQCISIKSFSLAFCQVE